MSFVSTTNPDDVFIGASSSDGTYQVSYRMLKGLPLGNYRITITMYALPNGMPLPPAERGENSKSEARLVTLSYIFEQKIVAGSNKIDFELTQGKKVLETR